MQSVEFWRTLAICVAAVGQTAFVLLYVTFPWWDSFLGRALFFKSLALCALVDVAVVGRVYDWRYEDQTFVGLYSLMALGILAQLSAFIRVRYRNNVGKQFPDKIEGHQTSASGL
jgi:hypothetical protein